MNATHISHYISSSAPSWVKIADANMDANLSRVDKQLTAWVILPPQATMFKRRRYHFMRQRHQASSPSETICAISYHVVITEADVSSRSRNNQFDLLKTAFNVQLQLIDDHAERTALSWMFSSFLSF